MNCFYRAIEIGILAVLACLVVGCVASVLNTSFAPYVSGTVVDKMENKVIVHRVDSDGSNCVGVGAKRTDRNSPVFTGHTEYAGGYDCTITTYSLQIEVVVNDHLYSATWSGYDRRSISKGEFDNAHIGQPIDVKLNDDKTKVIAIK